MPRKKKKSHKNTGKWHLRMATNKDECKEEKVRAVNGNVGRRGAGNKKAVKSRLRLPKLLMCLQYVLA